MNTKDGVRVLKGLGLVLRQVAIQNRSEYSDRIGRAVYHLSELVTVLRETYVTPTIKPASSADYTSANKTRTMRNKDIDIDAAVNAAVSLDLDIDNSNNHEDKEVTTKVSANIDRIGFSLIDKDDSAPSNDIPSNANTRRDAGEVKGEVKPNNGNHSAVMRERSVPGTQVERFLGFGSLAARMVVGSVFDTVTHSLSGAPNSQRSISEENADRFAEALCRMRGAALKLGQMLSLQDDASLPPALAKALERVKQAADYMPKAQLEKQLVKELGPEWRSKFLDFDMVPMAAASIGQVHKARLLDNSEVAVKVQYPYVADSITSDLNNLRMLVNMSNVLPPGLFIDQIIKVAGTELAWECDYNLEARSQVRYRELVQADAVLGKHVAVPQVYLDYCTDRVLTTELVQGIPIDKAAQYSQATRNAIARTLLIVTIRELFEWRLVQSDPNFANFLYDHDTRTINMIDFGATREYDKPFVDGYMRLVWAAANKEEDVILQVSRDLGFITGDEMDEFVEAHVQAGLVVGEPFAEMKEFDFGNSRLTARLGQYSGTFLKHRLTPPPTEAYSLHRKLAGAFLLCIKIKANICCRDILEDTFRSYSFDPSPPTPPTTTTTIPSGNL